MLSAHSFNALLKTLEEPPPHVKFLLATTDPQKLPVTVLSRCLQFNLKRLSVGLIAERMRQILESEGIAAEPAGVRLVAQAADGSMRDGLSLLDQLIAFGDGRVSEEGARAMLGTIARDHVVRLGELLGGLDARAIVAFARSLEEWAPDYAQVLEELAGLLARVALRQVVPDIDGDELYDPALLERLAKTMAPEDVQLFYQIALTGRRDLALAPDPRTGFEMTLLRMLAFRPAESAAAPVAASTGAHGAAPPAASLATPSATPSAAPLAAPLTAPPAAARASPALRSAPATPLTASPADGGAAPAPALVSATSTVVAGAADSQDWAAIVAQLDLQGAARVLANHCVMLGRRAGVVRLAIDPKQAPVRTRAQEDKLVQALSKYFGEPVRVEIEVGAAVGAETPAQAEQRASTAQLEAARAGLENDPTVLALKERFGAKLLPDTIKPIK